MVVIAACGQVDGWLLKLLIGGIDDRQIRHVGRDVAANHAGRRLQLGRGPELSGQLPRGRLGGIAEPSPQPRHVALAADRAGQFHRSGLRRGQDEVVRIHGHRRARQAGRVDAQPPLLLVPRPANGRIHPRLVHVQPRRGHDQRRNGESGLTQVHAIGRGNALNLQQVGPGKLPSGRRPPCGQSRGPVLQLSLRLHAKSPSTAVAEILDRLGKLQIELIGPGFDANCRGIDPRFCAEVGLPSGREPCREIRFAPPRLARRPQLEVVELKRGVSVELLRRALPVEAARTLARYLHGAQFDELAQPVGQQFQVESQRGSQGVERAIGVHLEEVRLAVQRVDDRACGILVGFQITEIGRSQVTGPLPVVAVRLATSNCPSHAMPCWPGRLLSAKVACPELICTCWRR